MTKINSLFQDYMENNNMKTQEIDFNIKVINLLYVNVLKQNNKCFGDIDTYIFDEFTDRIDIFDKELGGREGIEKALSAMLVLTEFLKSRKMIKGGKIAYYRKIFRNKEYYLEKYDKAKGKNDSTKDFIKEVAKNKISYWFVRVVDQVNINSFYTLNRITEILDSIEIYEENILTRILKSLDMIAPKGSKLIATKKGRAFLRLEAEEKYASLLYMFIYKVNWNKILKKDINIAEIILTVSKIFKDNSLVEITEETVYEDVIALSRVDSRLNVLIEDKEIKEFLDIAFIGMGIIEREIELDSKKYTISDFGKNIVRIFYNENKHLAKEKITNIETYIRNKDFDNLEKEILNFIRIFGENTLLFYYIGQIYMIKKKYREAYNILLYTYNTSNNIKYSKKILTNIITCCRKLKFNKEEKFYEDKYKLI